MAYKFNIKTRAISLRKRGYSLKEVSEKLKIAKSTASDWLRKVDLSIKAQDRLKKKKIFGQYKGRKVLLQRRQDEIAKISKQSQNLVSKLTFDKRWAKVCCALLFWCEGSKALNSLRFTNSDPILIKLFLMLLRQGFKIDEKKMRGLVHIHQYHNDEKQKMFWSKTTGIPISQFSKSYLKQNTGNNKHPNYPGCLAIYYYDARVAKELASIYNTFAHRGVSQRQAGTLQKFK